MRADTWPCLHRTAAKYRPPTKQTYSYQTLRHARAHVMAIGHKSGTGVCHSDGAADATARPCRQTAQGLYVFACVQYHIHTYIHLCRVICADITSHYIRSTRCCCLDASAPAYTRPCPSCSSCARQQHWYVTAHIPCSLNDDLLTARHAPVAVAAQHIQHIARLHRAAACRWCVVAVEHNVCVHT